jgi:hypothetical protein
MDPSRVESMADWPTLKSYANIQQFISFTNFYRRFIKNYSKIVKPLTNQLKGIKKGRKQGDLQ